MANNGGFPSWDSTHQSMMRAGHVDRERTVDLLKAAFTEGRLGQDEYEQRVAAAYRAQTYGELGALVADVPQGPVPMQPPMAPPYPVAPMPATFLPVPRRPTNGLAVASLLCGLGGLFLVVPTVPAIVLGHVARGQVHQRKEAGEGMATTGLVLGWLGAVFWTLVIIVSVAGG
ncbi:DUF1707 and DUF4190 domain-containing protein [Streptantibioticus parmotrematis]|uniref:DUF1707 and DUF4190 domain-containing protein n=1 Tax=Streptantibioticus parmotrematis TaxID=2873249 RepID=UPI00340296B2